MKLQRIKLAEHRYSWLVLDDRYLPIKPIQEFIRYLENVERSPNTIQAYANHLKLYWEYLLFIGEARRLESTVNTILAAVSSFYNFHQQLGNTEILLVKTSTNSSRRYKPLLHHITKSKPIKTRLVKLKQPKTFVKTLTTDQVKEILAACCSVRDQFLISLLYEGGLRIGQALGLRHCDIKSWDNEIHIQPRPYNENQARTKSIIANIIHVSVNLMTLYSRYLLDEVDVIDSDYVFIQTSQHHTQGKPLNYRAIRDLFARITKKVGYRVSPHMLRHTHATELLRNGWDASYVQRRLGHRSIQTTINTYANLSNSDLKKAFLEYKKEKKHESEKFKD